MNIVVSHSALAGSESLAALHWSELKRHEQGSCPPARQHKPRIALSTFWASWRTPFQICLVKDVGGFWLLPFVYPTLRAGGERRKLIQCCWLGAQRARNRS